MCERLASAKQEHSHMFFGASAETSSKYDYAFLSEHLSIGNWTDGGKYFLE